MRKVSENINMFNNPRHARVLAFIYIYIYMCVCVSVHTHIWGLKHTNWNVIFYSHSFVRTAHSCNINDTHRIPATCIQSVSNWIALFWLLPSIIKSTNTNVQVCKSVWDKILSLFCGVAANRFLLARVTPQVTETAREKKTRTFSPQRNREKLVLQSVLQRRPLPSSSSDRTVKVSSKNF